MRALLRWLINAIAVWVAIQIVPGIQAEGGWAVILAVALILGLANAMIKPLLTILSCPLLILTLGLFTLVINAAVLMVTSWLAGLLGLDFVVSGFGAAFWGGIVISIVSVVLSVFLADEKRRSRER